MKKLTFGMVTLLAAAILLQSCAPAATATVTMVPQEQMNTSVAGTVAVLETRVAALAQTATAAPTATHLPSATPTADDTGTVQPKGASGSGCLDMMTFVGDITIPDNSIIPPGTVFTKTWAVKNSGYCTWDKNYSVVFTGGDQLGGAASSPLMTDGVVRPGETARVSVLLVAPDTAGERAYTGFWKLRNPSGAVFGWGDDGSRSIYVKIMAGNRFNFVDNIYSASWSNNDGAMFGSTENSPDGYFKQEKAPELENGLSGGSSLVMAPPTRQNGFIQARFMAVKVPSGSAIRGLVGCGFGKPNCNFKATIYASVEGQDDQEIGSWVETYDGINSEIGVPLSRYGLVGQQVRFTFRVDANGGSEDDLAVWQGIYLGE